MKVVIRFNDEVLFEGKLTKKTKQILQQLYRTKLNNDWVCLVNQGEDRYGNIYLTYADVGYIANSKQLRTAFLSQF